MKSTQVVRYYSTKHPVHPYFIPFCLYSWGMLLLSALDLPLFKCNHSENIISSFIYYSYDMVNSLSNPRKFLPPGRSQIPYREVEICAFSSPKYDTTSAPVRRKIHNL